MKNRALLPLAVFAVTGVLGSLAVAQQHHMMKGGMMPQTAASKKVMRSVDKIKAASNYMCCIRGKCDYCAVHMGACPCGPNAANDKPVCINCNGGWAAGLGIIPGKTYRDIKVMPMNGMVKGRMSSSRVPSPEAKLVDVWHCPITGDAIRDKKGVGPPEVVGNYRVHFCCPQCAPEFAKLSNTQKMAKVLAAVRDDATQ